MNSATVQCIFLRHNIYSHTTNDFPDMNKGLVRLASIASAVIQAIGRPDFEDGSRTGSTVEVKCDYHSVRTKPEVNMARHLM